MRPRCRSFFGASPFGREVPVVLRTYGVDADEVVEILSGASTSFHGLFAAPINLDTIEGIPRAARALGDTTLRPWRVVDAAVRRFTAADRGARRCVLALQGARLRTVHTLAARHPVRSWSGSRTRFPPRFRGHAHLLRNGPSVVRRLFGATSASRQHRPGESCSPEGRWRGSLLGAPVCHRDRRRLLRR